MYVGLEISLQDIALSFSLFLHTVLVTVSAWFKLDPLGGLINPINNASLAGSKLWKIMSSFVGFCNILSSVGWTLEESEDWLPWENNSRSFTEPGIEGDGIQGGLGLLYEHQIMATVVRHLFYYNISLHSLRCSQKSCINAWSGISCR